MLILDEEPEDIEHGEHFQQVDGHLLERVAVVGMPELVPHHRQHFVVIEGVEEAIGEDDGLG